MVVGLTGQIGSGKSTAAKILSSMGAVVIDADRIGREVVEQSPALLKKLVREFGRPILNRSGNLNRKKLAAAAFQNHQSKQKLNALVHPYLLKELRRQCRALSKTNELVVIDAALLLDWELDREIDAVIVVHASQQVRLDRLATRGISRRDALARQRAQLRLNEFRRRADHWVTNNTTTDALRIKLEQIVTNLAPNLLTDRH